MAEQGRDDLEGPADRLYPGGYRVGAAGHRGEKRARLLELLRLALREGTVSVVDLGRVLVEELDLRERAGGAG